MTVQRNDLKTLVWLTNGGGLMPLKELLISTIPLFYVKTITTPSLHSNFPYFRYSFLKNNGRKRGNTCSR